jgi:UPF0716 protein FxsA
MPVGKLILLGLLGLVVAEIAAFLTVASIFGIFAAALALIATSVLGVVVLMQMGRRFVSRVADILARRDFGAPAARSSGILTTCGALLLVLPGFITDCIGLLLLLPAVQNRLKDAAPMGRARQPSGRVLELDRSQWRDVPGRLEEDRDATPKVPPKGAPKTDPKIDPKIDPKTASGRARRP